MATLEHMKCLYFEIIMTWLVIVVQIFLVDAVFLLFLWESCSTV